MGAVLTLLGVVACPITLGDAAFRSVQFRIADALRIKQDAIVKHFFIAIPLFIACIILTQLNFIIL